jgi:NADH:ubiquinone oxidoreductase subunit K
MTSLNALTAVSVALFAIGIFGVLSRRNVLTVLMSIELIFNAATINFAAFNTRLHPNNVWGQGAALFIIALAAAESVVGFALILVIYRRFKSVLAENLNLLKG